MNRVGVAAATVALTLAMGCSSPDDSASTLRVFAATSLGDLLSDLATAFQADPGGAVVDDEVNVDINVAGSSTLRLQLNEGASADLFAPASTEQLQLLDVGTVGEPTRFATNRLVSAHRIGGPPIGIEQFTDTNLLLGACAPSVPCGAYAAAAFKAAGIEPALDTEEPDVRSLASKVAEGELDAGLVYATDVLADSRLAAVELPSSVDVSVLDVTYPVAQLTDAAHPELAAAFIEFLTTADARSIIIAHGFGLP